MAPTSNDPVADPNGPDVAIGPVAGGPADQGPVDLPAGDPLAELRRGVAGSGAPRHLRLWQALESWRAGPPGHGDGPLWSARPALVAVAAVLAALLVVGGAVVAWRGGLPGSGPGGDVAASLPRAGTGPTAGAGGSNGSAAIGPRSPGATGETSDTGGGSAAGALVVQAAGALVRPGVYHLAAGSRVGDLVDTAGGFTADADVDRVNLASPLTDGARIWVPRRGEADPPAPVDGGGGAPGSPGSPAGPAAPVDLNTATADELEALPGVGPATAAAIIDYRQRHGPFRTVDDLAEVRGIGDAKLAQLRDLVRV